MIPPNWSSRDWRYVSTMAPFVNLGGGNGFASMNQIETFGVAYDPGTHGMSLTYSSGHNYIGGHSGDFHQVDFIYPTSWGGPGFYHFEDDSLGGTKRFRVTLLQAQLQVAADCHCVLSADGLRLEVAEAEGDFTTVLELTDPFTQEWDGFDKRLDKCQESTVTGHGGETLPATIDCIWSHYADVPTFFLTVTAAITYSGFEYYDESLSDWVALDIIIPTDIAPPSTHCACTAEDIDLSDLSGTQSNNVLLNAVWIDDQSKGPEDIGSCACPEGSPGTQTWDNTRIKRKQKQTTTLVSIVPKSFGLLPIQIDTGAHCTDDDTDDEQSTSETDTTDWTECEIQRTIDVAVRAVTCSLGTQTACIPFFGGATSCHDVEPSTLCSYSGTVQQLWTEAPACSGSAAWPSYDVSHSQRHLRAYIDGSSIWTGFRSNGGAWKDYETSIEGQHPCIRLDRNSRSQKAFLWYDNAATVFRQTSIKEGKEWTDEITIGSGSMPTAVIAQSGQQFIYWISGTDILGQIRDRSDNIIVSEFTAVSGVDEAGICAGETVLGGGGHRVVLYAIVGGDLKRFDAPDGVAFGAGTSIGSGETPASVLGYSGQRFTYWISGSSVFGELRDRSDNITNSSFTAISPVDTEGLAADEWINGDGRHNVRVLAVAGGFLTEFNSTNGINFS